MAVITPQSAGIRPPAGGFKQGAWYEGRMYWGGTLSDPGVVHPSSGQVGAGQRVSAEVNRQSAALQGVSPQQFEGFLQSQRDRQTQSQPAPAPTPQPVPPVDTSAIPSDSGGDTSPVIQPPAEIDLPKLYDNLFAEAGISGVQNSIKEQESLLADKERAFVEAKGKINDNPFLSEATRVGRVAKLESLYQGRIANDIRKLENLQGEIETKKADVETKINLELQQFNLDSETAQRALTQLNTLLEMGALDNATGIDVANLTRSTGISSTMIQSAIKSRIKEPELNTTLQTIDDGSTQWGVLIDTDTGDVINRIQLARSKPKVFAPRDDTPSASDQKAEDIGVVGGIISRYITDIDEQRKISPESLYRQLSLQYPLAIDFLSENWTAADIRAARKKK
tara:strand:- start:1316 stop:2500 length:1185 start_codon:yes stop_codon:yes gene_type:complete